MATQEASPTKVGSSDADRGFWRGRAGVLLVNLVLAAAIVLGVLWLPPISLTKRLAEGSYTVLGEGILRVCRWISSDLQVNPRAILR